MKLTEIQESEYIRVKELRKIKVDPGEVLLIILGIDGLTNQEAVDYANTVAKTFRENLPTVRMMISTTTQQRPIEVIKIEEGDLLMDVLREDDPE